MCSAGEQSQIRMEGEVVLLNTLESMKTFDRKGAALGAIRKVEASVQSGTCLSDPTALNRFVMVCFADLKQYTFYYWVCVPAAKTADPILSEGFTQGVDQAACEACQEYYHSETKGRAPFWVLEGGEEGGYRCRPIDNGGEGGKDDEIATVAFVDPSHVAGSPGWPLRNFLWLLCGGLCGLRRVRVLCLRHEKLGRFSASRSAWHEVAIPPAGSDTTVNAVGWEHNSKGGLGPRSANLASTLDPKQRASSAMDLNLKLMKWRALPGLKTEEIAGARCLLLGAGTLGCAVARILQGWGCRKITFVDSGRVAFSNPVRQSLFQFEDCLDGGRPKAEAAAESLKRIFPDADAEGVQLSIPMPGHPVREGSDLHRRTLDQVSALDALISQHDVIFLLTDTRESRWLPTVLSLKREKLAVSVALGFDTFLVMRHGCLAQGSDRLGCYFCNDVAAPLNSTKNRTLDQQCTVVRPGLASIASALAVELVSSLLQHPLKGAAPDKSESILGVVPHSIRGFLDSFEQLKLSSPAFGNCVGCSPKILDAYDTGEAAAPLWRPRPSGGLTLTGPFLFTALRGLREEDFVFDEGLQRARVPGGSGRPDGAQAQGAGGDGRHGGHGLERRGERWRVGLRWWR